MILRRRDVATDAVLDQEVGSIREAEQRVAWCGTDNLNMTRKVASAAALAAGTAFRHDALYVLNDQYTFRLTDGTIDGNPLPETRGGGRP